MLQSTVLWMQGDNSTPAWLLLPLGCLFVLVCASKFSLFIQRSKTGVDTSLMRETFDELTTPIWWSRKTGEGPVRVSEVVVRGLPATSGLRVTFDMGGGVERQTKVP